MAEPFTVVERILLMQLLGQAKGTMEMMRAVDKFGREIGFGPKERESIALVQEGKRLRWNVDAAKNIEVDVSPLVKVAIQNILKEMDRQETLDLTLLPLWERFVEGKVPVAASPNGEVKNPSSQEATPVAAS